MAGLVLPLVQALPGREGGGAHEDSWDTLAMLRHSGPLQAVTAASLVFLAAYNLAGALRCALRYAVLCRAWEGAQPAPPLLICRCPTLCRHDVH